MDSTQQFWEDFYRDKDQVWSGKANPLLVREVAELTPGAALDLGCGEGGDAIWLTQRGWRVTAVDISDVALKRAAGHAAEAGADGIVWERHDLAKSFPEGSFDLVSAQFFHSPVAVDGERDKALRHASEAVAPGGTLIVAGHAGWPTWLEEPPHKDFHFPTPAEVLETLALADGWTVELQEVVTRDFPGPEGQQGTRSDNVLRVRRSA
ncbi:class I SAM-dependent methyltransferase [Amycolatopsis umgeniensis]|uniref:SAM-dependent methyltransferase n=1 Tax=Amycolatopsis umgeniensis TaxID=336628 RepID=A0A841BDR0_9PSEU|nr:class I SAM-dependent methyltransferase [Amycolatopsis umgeniensis]MBB5858126.1 SAM-dependent methyltransferase [Amycolatopsis umgeniensis]